MKYLVKEYSDHPSESDLVEEYRKGWILISVTSLYHPNYNSPTRRFWATFAYRGGSTAKRAA